MEGKPTVLVVDDDAGNRALLRGYLAERYDVLEAGDGPGALDRIDRKQVDLVLLDVMMPGMSGFDVCREIKRRSSGVILPVLLLTALSERADRIAGLEAGADDFLTKPIDRHELRLRVNAFVTLRRQEQTIRAQLEQLRHLGALKDDLVSLMVHDLRNPLTSVQVFLDFLQGEIEDPDLKSDAASAFSAALKLSETLNDMLEVRLLEEGKLVLQLHTYRLADVVRDAMATVEPAAKARGVGMTVAADDRLCTTFDRKLVRRAVENFLVNAVKYSPDGEIIEVGLRREDGGAEIDVADRGPGIPEVLREHLFEKYGSVELARGEARRGYGLGLYLVKLVAAAHQGHVVARNRDGGGTVFGLWLPEARTES